MNFDANAARTATRTCLAFGLALSGALYLNWQVTPALLTVQMLQAAQLGMAVRNSVTRFVGAVTAGFISLLILGVFPQDRFMFLLCYAALMAFANYQFQGSRNPYFWVIVTFVFGYIGLAMAGSPLHTFVQAVQVSSSFMLGGAAVILVNSLVWPNPMRTSFEGALAGTLQLIGKQFELRRAALFKGDTAAAADLQTTQSQALKTAASLITLLDFTAVESRQIDRFHTSYENLVNDVVVVGAEMISMEDMLAACLDSGALRQQLTESKALDPAMDLLTQELDALSQQAHASRDGSLTIEAAPAPDCVEGMDLTAMSPSDRALFEALRAKARQAWSALRALRVALANVENPEAPAAEALEAPKPETFSLPRFLSSFRFKWAMITGTAALCGAYLWLLTDWPAGLKIGIIVPTLGSFLARSWPGQRLAILTGLVIGPAVSWIVYFVVLPQLPDEFRFLYPTLILFFFPIVYLQAVKNPFWAMAGFIAGLGYCMNVSITHFQQYSFSSFTGGLIGFGGAILFGLAFYSLFMWSRTEKDFRLGLEAFFKLCRSTLLDFENVEQMPDALGRLSSRRKALVGAYQKCAGLTNRLPYSKVPQNDKGKVDALLGSAWTVAFRLDGMLRERTRQVAAGTLDADQGAAVRSVMADAMDALKLAAKQGDTVAQWPLAPAWHPEYDQLLQALSSTAEQGPASTATIAARLASAGFHRALSDAIKTAYERFNLLDWPAWETERF